MNYSFRASLALFMLFCVSQATAASLMLSSFNGHGFDYGFGSWEQLEKVTKVIKRQYVSIGDGATATGGAGLSSLRIDISEYDTIVVSVRVAENNKARAFNVTMRDLDGTQYGWRFDISTLKGDKFVKLSTALGSHLFINDDGLIPGLDVKQIEAWEIQGDYSGQEPIAIQVDEIFLKRTTNP